MRKRPALQLRWNITQRLKSSVSAANPQDRTRSVAPHAAAPRLNMSLVLEADSFTHILRIMSTNVDGKRKVWLLAAFNFDFYRLHMWPQPSAPAASSPCAQVPFALTAIRGLGRRFTTLACKKAGVNVHKRCVPRTLLMRPPRFV